MMLGNRINKYFFWNVGRVKCLVSSACLFVGCGIVSGLTWNIKVLYATFFVFGFSIMLFLITQDLYIKEISGERFQHFFYYNSALMWPIGQICAASLNLFLFSWRVTFIVFVSIPAAIIGYLMKTKLFESPVYYMQQGNFDQAKSILNYIALANSRLNFMFKLEGEKNKGERLNRGNSTMEVTYADFIRFKSLRVPMLFLCLSYMITQWLYFGSFLALWGYGESLQENFLMLAIAELLGCLLSESFIQRLGRIVFYRIFFFGLFGTSLFGYWIRLPEDCFYQTNSCVEEIVLVSLLMAFRFAIKLVQSLNEIYRQEALPKITHDEALKILGFFERLGALLVPLFYWLIKMHKSMIIYALVCGILLLFSFLLEETKDQKVEEQIQETKGRNQPLVNLNELNEPLL